MFDSGYTQQVRAMQSEEANEDILKLGNEMDIKNPLIEWYMHKFRFHRLVQRERCAGMIQTTRLVHHMLIERRRDLVCLTIVRYPHCSNHRTEANKLHRRREMDRLVRTFFISNSRMTRRKIRKFGNLQIAPDNALDCKVTVVQSERGFEWLFPIWEIMTRKVYPFVLAKLLNDPRNTGLLSIYARECGEAVDALANVDQLRAYRKEFALASSFGLTDGNEAFLFSCRIRLIGPSGANEGGQGWGVGRDVEMSEILLSPSYTDRARATQRTRRWDTTRCVIQAEMDGSPEGNRQSDPKVCVRRTQALSSCRPTWHAQSRYGAPLTGLERFAVI
jgi:hypothetical protein